MLAFGTLLAASFLGLWWMGDRVLWAGWIAVVGALITGGLGTYTSRNQVSQLPFEKPAALREWLLFDGSQPISDGRWRVYNGLRLSGAVVILLGFGLALWDHVEAEKEKLVTMEELGKIQDNINAIHRLPVIYNSVHGATPVPVPSKASN
jgi:hypothetical protein